MSLANYVGMMYAALKFVFQKKNLKTKELKKKSLQKGRNYIGKLLFI
jgi:hypothetical protein